MSEIKWNIQNPEIILGRIEALRFCIAHLEDSELVPIWEKELAELEAIPL